MSVYRFSLIFNLIQWEYTLQHQEQDQQIMKANEYPTISSLVKQLMTNLKEQCDPTDFQFQVKYSQLKSERNFAFTKLLNQSTNSILILNDFANYKQHRINADATQKQYEVILANCRKLKQAQKQKNIVKLNIKLGNEKIQKVVGIQNWVASDKERKLNRQFNALIDKKQFRIDLSVLGIVSENAQRILKQFDEKLMPSIKCMRFIDSVIFYPSPYYYIKLSQIYQAQEDKQKQMFFKAFQKDSPQQMDDYIVTKIPKNNKIPPKYEIQLVMTEEGIKKIMKLIKNREQLSTFIGDLLNDFKNLSNPQYNVTQDISQLMSGLKI